MPFMSSIETIMKNRRMSVRLLAERTGIDFANLQAAIEDGAELDDDEINEVATQLGVPTFALFSKRSLPLSELPDFRKPTPSVGLLQSGSIKALGYIEKLSLSLASLDLDLSPSKELRKHDGPLTRKGARKLAEAWRKSWGISNDDQLEWKDANKVYASLRQFIEGLGVFVLHYNFGSDDVSGLYARVDGGPHTVLINTRGSSKARKLFTLAHEFCHVLLRADGVSNATVARNKTEVFCNQFAASLLAPKTLIQTALNRYGYKIELFGDSIRLLARNLGISQQALVLRLVDEGFLENKDYTRWMAQFKGRTPTGDESDGPGGGNGNDHIKSKRTKYGHSLLRTLSEAKKEGLLDDIDIYRLSGIKPIYQNALLGA